MSLEELLVKSSSVDDWQAIIEAGTMFSVKEKSKFLWAWPSVRVLQWLKTVLIEHNIGHILSIGSGSGLLEWLIMKTAGVTVVGLELDQSWWSSAYSPKKFVNIKFTENQITCEFLRKCIQVETSQFALLFCYFNNHDAFLEYIRAYDGDLVIIIGPNSTQHIVTDPNPLNPNFEHSNEWSLHDYCQFNDELSNCISIFKRIKCNG